MPYNFFKIKQTPNRFLKTTTAYYPVAEPTNGSGVIDVYGSFRWKNAGSIDEVPSITLTEYKLNTGARVANLLELLGELSSDTIAKGGENLISNLAGTVKTGVARSIFGDPYQGLYIGEPTGFYYNLPYLKNSASIRGEGGGNEWTTNKTVLDSIMDMLPTLKSVGNALGSAVAGLKDEGWGAEEIYKYGGSKARSVTITFPLFNTHSIKEANDNFSFISLFAFQNLKTRTSYMTFLPPKVYVVDCLDEGGIYMPIAVVQDFKVEGLGSLRKMSDFGAGSSGEVTTGYRLMPEAYRVSITLRELIPETTNIMQGALGQGKVQVIGDVSTLRGNGGGVTNYNGVEDLSPFDFVGDSSGTTGTPTAVGINPYTSDSNSNQSFRTVSDESSRRIGGDEVITPYDANISGYTPGASPDINDPMVIRKNISGYDPLAPSNPRDPMGAPSIDDTTYKESSIPQQAEITPENEFNLPELDYSGKKPAVPDQPQVGSQPEERVSIPPNSLTQDLEITNPDYASLLREANSLEIPLSLAPQTNQPTNYYTPSNSFEPGKDVGEEIGRGIVEVSSPTDIDRQFDTQAAKIQEITGYPVVMKFQEDGSAGLAGTISAEGNFAPLRPEQILPNGQTVRQILESVPTDKSQTESYAREKAAFSNIKEGVNDMSYYKGILNNPTSSSAERREAAGFVMNNVVAYKASQVIPPIDYAGNQKQVVEPKEILSRTIPTNT